MKQINWAHWIAGQAGVIPLSLGIPGVAKTASHQALAQATGRTFHAYMLDQSLPEDLGGYKVMDTAGNAIVDCFNSGVIVIHDDYFDDEFGSRWDDQGRLNCRAISAVPELIEACVAAIVSTGGSEYWNGHTQAFLLLCEAALAKAVGQYAVDAAKKLAIEKLNTE